MAVFTLVPDNGAQVDERQDSRTVERLLCDMLALEVTNGMFPNGVGQIVTRYVLKLLKAQMHRARAAQRRK